MKVSIKHVRFFGCYQLAEKLLGWLPKRKNVFGQEVPVFADALGAFLSTDRKGESSRLANLFQRLHNWRVRNNKDVIKLTGEDIWDAKVGLAKVISAVLNEFRKDPKTYVEVEEVDIPHHARYNGTIDYKAAWAYVLDEMVWAFEQQALDDWENLYYTVDEEGRTFEFNKEGHKIHQDRITRGTILFGKYFNHLWD